MADLVVIVGVLAFLAVCMAYVLGCGRIIGPDTPEAGTESETDDADRVSLPSVPGSAR